MEHDYLSRGRCSKGQGALRLTATGTARLLLVRVSRLRASLPPLALAPAQGREAWAEAFPTRERHLWFGVFLAGSW